MGRPSQRTLRKYSKPLEFDPSPLYHVEVVYDENGIGHLDHSGAFDPRYECECDDIEGRHSIKECGQKEGIRGTDDV
jgi:hypothetical protein